MFTGGGFALLLHDIELSKCSLSCCLACKYYKYFIMDGTKQSLRFKAPKILET